MKTHIIISRLAVLLFYYIAPHILFSQWTFLGDMDKGSGIIKEYHGVYYALNQTGIYKSDSFESHWEYLDGSNQFTGHFMSSPTDFWVQDSSILVEWQGDTSQKYYSISDDLGKNWRTFSILQGSTNFDFRQSNDALLVYHVNAVQMMTNGFKFTEDSILYYNIPLNFKNYIAPREKCYLIKDYQIITANPGFFQVSKSEVLFDLPSGWEFQQMLQADNKLFIWMNNQDSSTIFIYEPESNLFKSGLTFPKTTYFPRFHYGAPCYLKYENGIVFLVRHSFIEPFKTYFSKDLGENWLSTIVVPRGKLDFIGQAIFYTGSDSIFYSLDDGQTFIPKVKGIFFNLEYNSKESIYVSENDVYLQLTNGTTFQLDEETKTFFEIKQHKGVSWQSTSSGDLYGIKNYQFCHFDKSDSTWNCDFSINQTGTFSQLTIMNDVLFIKANSKIYYSLNGGEWWFNTIPANPDNIFYSQGYYYFNDLDYMLRSNDLFIWHRYNLSEFINFEISSVISDGDQIYLYNETYNRIISFDVTSGTFISKKSPPFYHQNFKKIISTDNGNILAWAFNNLLYLYNPEQDTWKEQTDFDQIKIFDVVAYGDDVYALNPKGLWKKSLAGSTSSEDIEDFSKSKHELNIFPIPFTDWINISVDKEVKIRTIAIIDGVGKETKIPLISLDTAHKIDLSFLSSGVYFLHVTTSDGQSLFGKVVKM